MNHARMNNITLSCSRGVPLVHIWNVQYISLKSSLLDIVEVSLPCILRVSCYKSSVKTYLSLMICMHHYV